MSVKFNYILIILSISFIGFCLHGIFLDKLGIYRDDAWLLMQGMQVTDGSIINFILSDTAGSFLKERPVSYFAWIIARAGFAASLLSLHLILIFLLILNSIVLSILSYRIFHSDWFAFSVGILFLFYPLSPMQAIMALNIHYLFSLLFTLLATLFAVYGLNNINGTRLYWFALSALMYLLSLLTHEIFAFVYPIFIILPVLLDSSQRAMVWNSLRKTNVSAPALQWLVSFLSILGLFLFWRKLILPIYEATYFVGLPSYGLILNPVFLAEKLIIGADTIFMPWDQVFWQILRFRIPPWTILLAIIVSFVTWMITSHLLIQSQDFRPSFASVTIANAKPWWQALIIGILLALAIVCTVGLSATNKIDTIKGLVSRVNFGALVGIAIALPALLILLTRLYFRYTKRAKLIFPMLVLFIGLLHLLIRKPMIDDMLGRYPTNYGLKSVVLMVLGALIILIVIKRINSQTVQRRVKHLLAHKTNFGNLLLPEHVLATVIAFLVLLGSIFHLSVKQEYAYAWNNYKEMVRGLQDIAPGFKDHTFVLVVVKPGNELVKRVVAGTEFSIHLLTLYENWSIMGLVITKGESDWKFYSDGLDIPDGTWFPPGVRGPFVTHATMPISRVGYDRFSLFEFDGSNLRKIPEIEVETVDGDHIVLQDNPDRIVARGPVTTPVWQYVTQ
jgi:hypothetical protein